MMQLLIKKATILSPNSKFHLKKKDIFIKNGRIEKIADSIVVKGGKTIDQKNTFISIGWMDLFSNFCDPGYEHKEDLQSGSESAVAGGYTDVCLIPNTNPVINNKSLVENICRQSGIVNLHPIGTVSNNADGKDLAEMYDMKLAGAVAFSDGIKPVQQSGLFLKALQYVKAFNGVIIQVPEDTSISKNGLMHEGVLSTQLGVQGKPTIAETIIIQRDLELLRYTESAIHFTGISTKKSVDLIRKAKKEGLKVSCSVTPYHLLFTDASLNTYDSNFKVNPPLRSEEDRLALLKGIEDGTIDCITSHHFPQDWDAKNVEFEYAKSGMIGLQTVLPILLQASDKISVEKWIELITNAPRRILGMLDINIEENSEACLTVFNTDTTWTFDSKTNKSKSANSPFMNQSFKGKVLAVVNNQQVFIHE